MDFISDSQNTSPGQSSMNQQAKLNGATMTTNSHSVTKRLQSELMSLMMSPTEGISAFPDESGNMTHWIATIDGPNDTPYAGLKFKLDFEFPANYPYAPPTVLFKTPIYHPNIDFSGRICLDILKDKWSASYSITTVLLSLQSLLGEPNNSSPLNNEAAVLHEKNPEEYNRKVLARHVDLDAEQPVLCSRCGKGFSTALAV